MVVRGEQAVRAAPSVDARVIGSRAGGEEVIADEVRADGSWLRISSSLDTREGYELYDRDRGHAWMLIRDGGEEADAGELLREVAVLDSDAVGEETAVECS